METIDINDRTYRIKPMNAIETLALQSQISFDSVEESMKCYGAILERVEVEVKDKWLQVKESGKEVYYPAGIEDDILTIRELITFVLKFIKEVFQKSNASNSTQE